MSAKQYVDLNGITVYDEEIKDYIAGLGIGVTYTLTQDSQDPHKLILTPSQGQAQEVTVPDNNTTYALSLSGNNLVLTPSSGSADSISLGDLAFEDSLTASDVGAIPTSAIGSNSGVAELDAAGKVPSSQLPSYVDDVEEYSSKSSFPVTGETGKIYVDMSDNTTYRWSGSDYVSIGSSLALGETSSTAYRGDRGKTAYDHATDAGRLTTAQSSGLYKIATTAEGHVANVTAVQKSDITDLGIPAQDTTWTTHLYAGTGAAANAATTNGNTKLTVTDDSTVRNTVTIQGSGGTSVSSNASGVITINSSATAGPTLLSGSIAANATSLSFTNAAIGNNTRFDVYTSVYGVNPTNMTQSGTTLTLTFSNSHVAANIRVHCWNT